jgi:hypothetical protein
MTRRRIACGLLTALAFGGPIAAQADPVVVVELYTSQGCSSCPPADEYLASLVGDPSVMPLAMHVDYWDYIGWKDTFSMHKFTERQQAYARVEGSRTIYTPQMIVGGVDQVVGNNPQAINALIRAHQDAAATVALDVARKGDTLVISADATGTVDGPLDVVVVRYLAEEEVAIKRGENAGRTINYHNVVTAWDRVGEWSGAEPLQMEATITGREEVVVILQRRGPAAIMAAAIP